MVIPESQTSIDPGTVVVAFCHAGAAKTAVLGSCWLHQIASRADHAGTEEDVVVWIVIQSSIMARM